LPEDRMEQSEEKEWEGGEKEERERFEVVVPRGDLRRRKVT